nr:WAT1-related protein At5g07050-like [Ipomoea batatas]
MVDHQKKVVIFIRIIIITFFNEFDRPVVDQNLYYAGLKFTSPSFSCAMSNILPAMAFVMGVVCKMEKVNIKKTSSFDKDWVKGSILLILATIAWASFFILQAITLKKYTAQLSLTAMVCFIGTLQSIAVTFVMEHRSSVWSIGWDLNLFAAAYAYREYKEKEAEEIQEAVKGISGNKNERMMVIIEEEGEGEDDIEMQKAPPVAIIAISPNISQPPMLAMEAPKH